MKIDQTSLAFIDNVVKTADLFKVGSIIIEPNRLRAVDEGRTIVLFQEANIPDLPFGSIGINRIDSFTSRFEIVRTMDNFLIDVTVDESKPEAPFARALTLKAKGIKIDYRCANPATIQAPKQLTDVVKYKVQISPEAVLYMQKSQSAMKSDDITIAATAEGVSFELSDISSDKLTYQFADKAEHIDGTQGSPVIFSHRYPIKNLVTMFKSNPTGYFYVSPRGMLKFVVNNLDVYALPRT